MAKHSLDLKLEVAKIVLEGPYGHKRVAARHGVFWLTASSRYIALPKSVNNHLFFFSEPNLLAIDFLRTRALKSEMATRRSLTAVILQHVWLVCY